MRFLLTGLISIGSVSGFAQSKAACDFISKSEAALILGTAVDALPGEGVSQCRFGEIGFTGVAPKIKQVGVKISSSTSPNGNAYAVARQTITGYQRCLGCPAPPTMKEFSDLGDAAVWGWYPGLYGVLYAFKGGTTQVEVVIQGIPEASAVENAKALAAKALGGAGGTGYAYLGTPKGNAIAAATRKASAPAPVPGGKVFSQARYITPSQFLRALREVSVTLDSPAIAQFMTPAEQTSYVSKALEPYGIAVKPNTPVSLLVTIDYQPMTIRETRTGGIYPTPVVSDRHTHVAFLSLDFYVRSAFLRHGKFHLVMGAPVGRWEASGWKGGTDPGGDLREWIAENLGAALKAIASDEDGETGQWFVNSWSEKEKAAADTQLAAVMKPQAMTDRLPYEDVDSAPKLDLVKSQSDKKCPVDPSWGAYWASAFQRLRWTNNSEKPTLLVNDQFACSNEHIQYGPNYFMIWDVTYLVESDAVFELNGQLFRRSAELSSTHRITNVIPDNLDSTLQPFFRQNVSEFLTELVLGSRGLQ